MDLEETERSREGAKEVAPRGRLLLFLEESLLRRDPDPSLKFLQSPVARCGWLGKSGTAEQGDLLATPQQARTG
jgi:hypothetical protein